jgi:hypothetical protein
MGEHVKADEPIDIKDHKQVATARENVTRICKSVLGRECR